MSKLLVIGGGAAGMFAAIFAARNGHEVHIFEKNEKLGKKLYITGKGRCNITNASEMNTLFSAIVCNPKFLYSSFYSYSNEDTISFFEELGVATKIERGNRVFPVSDKSSEVIGALTKELKRLKVQIHYKANVKTIVEENQAFQNVVLANEQVISGDACLIATGGYSYQTTGSTGDGYRFAEKMGHMVTPLYPSLVPLEVAENFVKDLQGLSLRNIKIIISINEQVLVEEFGEMLFTHFGVSGPLILSASSVIGEQLGKSNAILKIDLKPALTQEQLDQRILRDFSEQKNKQFKNALSKLFPAKLIPVMLEQSEIDPNKKVNMISKEERKAFVLLIKNFKLTITKLRDFNEAIITKGGVNIKEIDPGTMESKRIQNVYFAGEVLDLDALTGGYNLQIAWSTAYMAAMGVKFQEEVNGM